MEQHPTFRAAFAVDIALGLMKRLAVLAALASSVSVHAADLGNCFMVVCHVDGKESEGCTVSPANLMAKLPAGLAIASIRSFTKILGSGDSGERTCPRIQRLEKPVSLDRGSLYGAIEITGTLKAHGFIRFEPNDGGELEFRPDAKRFNNTGPFFRSTFNRVKLDEAEPKPHIRPPRSLAKADCWQAMATMEATDFGVVVGDTSSAGTYTRKLKLSRIHDFKACQWGGE